MPARGTPMPASEHPACPPWCADSSTPGHFGTHISDGFHTRLPASDYAGRDVRFVFAYVIQREKGEPGVVIRPRAADGESTSTSYLTGRAAEAIARLAELLADATPEAHRRVAAVIRQAISTATGGAA